MGDGGDATESFYLSILWRSKEEEVDASGYIY